MTNKSKINKILNKTAEELYSEGQTGPVTGPGPSWPPSQGIDNCDCNIGNCGNGSDLTPRELHPPTENECRTAIETLRSSCENCTGTPKRLCDGLIDEFRNACKNPRDLCTNITIACEHGLNPPGGHICTCMSKLCYASKLAQLTLACGCDKNCLAGVRRKAKAHTSEKKAACMQRISDCARDTHTKHQVEVQ